MHITDSPADTTMRATEACHLLHRETGVSLRAARAVLAAGLAVPGNVTGAGYAYDAGLVEALCARETLNEANLWDACPEGFFVARRTDIVLPADAAGRRAAVAVGWEPFARWSGIPLDCQLPVLGPLPFIATMSGFVYLCAELVGVHRSGRLDLAEPGAWCEQVQDTRVSLGPGRPWVLRLPPVRPPVTTARHDRPYGVRVSS